jgi:hypothetical protein
MISALRTMKIQTPGKSLKNIRLGRVIFREGKSFQQP